MKYNLCTHNNHMFTWKKTVISLTLLRMIIGLPLLLLLENESFSWAFVLFSIGGATDYLDGYLARKYKCKSILGARLDPLADKILIFAPLLWISKTQLIPIWAIWLLFSRELIVSSWRSSVKDGAPASIYGKAKTSLQFISILLIIWPNTWGGFSNIYLIHSFGILLFWVSLLLAIISLINYINLKTTYHPN